MPLGRVAASTPSGMPSRIASARLETASAIVCGSAFRIRRVTGWLLTKSRPRSPRKACPTNCVTCAGTDLSSPICSRTVRTSSGVDLWPRIALAGSPGTTCTSSARNTMSRTATRSAIPIRLIRYWSTTPRSTEPALLQAEVPRLVEAGGLQRRPDALLPREVARRPGDPDDVRFLVPELLHPNVDVRPNLGIEGLHGLGVPVAELPVAPGLPVPDVDLAACEPFRGERRLRGRRREELAEELAVLLCVTAELVEHRAVLNEHLHLDADVGQVRLHDLSDRRSADGGPRSRHRQLEAAHARLREEALRLVEVTLVRRRLLPVTHRHSRRQERPGPAPLAVERGRQDRRHVDRVADRLAHVDVLQVRVRGVHADPAVVERRTRVDLELRVRLEVVDSLGPDRAPVDRAALDRDRRRVGDRDRQELDPAPDRRLHVAQPAAAVAFELLEDGVLTRRPRHELVRAGSDWVMRELVAEVGDCLPRHDVAGEARQRVRQERREFVLEDDRPAVAAGDAHFSERGPIAFIRRVDRRAGQPGRTLERELDVGRSHLAVAAVELDPLPELEVVAEPVLRGLPLVREHGDELVGARLEADEPLVDVRQHGALVRAGDERRVQVLDVADGADAQDASGPGRSE